MLTLMLLAGLADPSGLHTVLGQLTEQAVPKCEGTTVNWVDPYLEVGFVPVRDSAVDLRGWLGKPVWIRGKALAGSRTFLRNHPCVMAQWRGDWIPGPHGVRSLDHGEIRPKGFVVEAAGPIELTAERSGDQLSLRFANPLPGVLAKAQVSIQYEGCYGKPGTDRRASAPVDLAAGATATLQAPVHTERERVRGAGPRGQWHRADTVRVHGEAAGVLMDLAVPLHSLGVSVKCPEQGTPGRKAKLPVKAGGPRRSR